ncbi:efflux RND transporter periplasmic adaptor subunit [Roseivivax sp. CAU 1761]
MRFLRRSLTGLVLTAAALGLLLYAGLLVRDAVEARLSREPRVPQAEERVFFVNVVQAEAVTVRPVLTAYGEVRSRRELELRAGASGRVVELAPAFVEGGRVAEGQVLLRIDPAEAEAARDRAEADLEDAAAEAADAERARDLARDNLAASEDQVALYERALQRQRDLDNRGVGSASAVEQAELQLSAARAAVIQRRQAVAEAEARISSAATARRRAEIALAEAERALEDTVIRAGFDGVLAEVSLVEGRRVSASEQVARLIDPAALEVAFRVSTQGYARLLDAGDLVPADVTATLDVFGAPRTAEGRIDRAAGAVAEGETGRLVYAGLGPAPGFRPGDFVTVRVTEAPLDDVVRLPATALDASGSVLALGADDRLDAVPVDLLRRQGDEVLVAARAELLGREVVAQRTPLLGAGIRVRAVGSGGAATAEAAESEEMVALSDDRRARLVALVEASARLPEAAKERILAQLAEPEVPAAMVQRLEARIGG